MSYYYELFPLYKQSTTWQEFLNLVSNGPGKWLLLQAIEEGWSTQIHLDLRRQFHVSDEEVSVLLDRYQSLVYVTPKHASVSELTQQLGRVVNAANILRAYFRYAYYVAVDEPDVIFTILDEQLTRLGVGTPTRDECARGYTTITGKHVNPDAVVLSAGVADELANQLAAEMEDVQRKLPQVVGGPTATTELINQIRKLNSLHVQLTGKSLLSGDELSEVNMLLQGKILNGGT